MSAVAIPGVGQPLLGVGITWLLRDGTSAGDTSTACAAFTMTPDLHDFVRRCQVILWYRLFL